MRRLAQIKPLKKWGLAVLGLSLFLSAPSLAGPKPLTWVIEQDRLYPEGIDYDPGCQCFLISSVGQGKIGRVFMDGRYRVFSDDLELVSTVGLLVDSKRQRLYVAMSDSRHSAKSQANNQYKIAKLGIFNLNNGQKLQSVDLGILKPGSHFANDIALDDEGNVYITDSRADVLYKVTPDGQASIFLEHAAIGPNSANGYGLNGIVYHKDGFLLSVKSDSGELFKIPLSNPNSLMRVQIQEKLGKGLDGLELTPEGKLAVVANQDAELYLLESQDNWKSAKIAQKTQMPPQTPTTVTQKSGQLFVLHANFGQAMAKRFLIQEAQFKD